MEGQLGVKETLELLEGMKVLATTAGEVMEDGKVDVKDLSELLVLVSKLGTLKDAVVGADKSLKEMKDLTQEEVSLVLAKVWEVLRAFQEGKKPDVVA